MSPMEAFNLIEKATAMISCNRQDQMTMMRALEVLKLVVYQPQKKDETPEKKKAK